MEGEKWRVRSGGEGGCPIRHAATTIQRRLTLSRRGELLLASVCSLIGPMHWLSNVPPWLPEERKRKGSPEARFERKEGKTARLRFRC